MATYFDPDRQSNVDYTNVKKVLDDVLPGSSNLEAPSPGLFVSTASTCSPTIRRSAASSSRLAVRRVPTTPSITCGRSYGTIINFCYRVNSKIGPRACRQSRTRTSDKNSFASSRSLRKSSIKMSFVPRGSSTSEINRPTVTSTQCYKCRMTTPVLS